MSAPDVAKSQWWVWYLAGRGGDLRSRLITVVGAEPSKGELASFARRHGEIVAIKAQRMFAEDSYAAYRDDAKDTSWVPGLWE